MGIKRQFKRRKQQAMSSDPSKKDLKSAKEKMMSRMEKMDHPFDIRMVDTPAGRRKLSEVILEFAAPLIEPLPADEEGNKPFRNMVTLAILVWNASLMAEEKRKETIATIMDTVSGSDPKAVGVLESIIKILLKRKEELFPDEDRFVVDYEISISKDRRDLFVASPMYFAKPGDVPEEQG